MRSPPAGATISTLNPIISTLNPIISTLNPIISTLIAIFSTLNTRISTRITLQSGDEVPACRRSSARNSVSAMARVAQPVPRRSLPLALGVSFVCLIVGVGRQVQVYSGAYHAPLALQLEGQVPSPGLVYLSVCLFVCFLRTGTPSCMLQRCV